VEDICTDGRLKEEEEENWWRIKIRGGKRQVGEKWCIEIKYVVQEEKEADEK
jgi:hypothetical protein